MTTMEKEDFDVHGVGEVISSSGCEDMASTAVTVKEEICSDESSDVKPDNTFETVLVNSNETVPCPKLEKAPESVNDMGTPFLFVGVKMEMPDDYESEVSCENIETQYSSEEYSMNDENECKGGDESSERSSPMIPNDTSCVEVKMECKEDIEICEFDLQTNDDISMTTDSKCTFDSTSEEIGCVMGHSSEKFINGMEYLEHPILRVKEEGEHTDEQIAENRNNSAFGQNLDALNSEEEKEPNETFDEAETLKSRECATEYNPEMNREWKYNHSKGKRLSSNVRHPISDKGLRRHKLSHTGKRSFSCITCLKSFSSMALLESHIRTHTGEKPYSCDICQKSFSMPYNLKIHMRTHTGEKPFSCEICEKSFSVKFSLQIHLQTHSGVKPFSCDICPKSFSQSYYLKIHMQTHTNEKPYSCDICYKPFSKKHRLVKHRGTHTGLKPYSCVVCPASFSMKDNLRNHVRTHSSIKRFFTCDTCQKSFSHKQNLKVHLSTHSGERPYTCDVCQKSFPWRSSLKLHTRTHTNEKPYSCDICHKSYSLKQSFERHLPVHTGEKPFSCDICQKSFALKGYLKNHMRTHTGEKRKRDVINSSQ